MTKKQDNMSNYSMWITGVQTVILFIVMIQLGFIGAQLDGATIGTGAANVPNQPTAPTPSAPSADSVAIASSAVIDDDAVLGDQNAQATIVEFSDFECPFCGRFYTQTLSSIKSQYIDTGKVNLVYRDFPLSFHQQAKPAAIAAECAGEQGMYYEMHDLMFENQQSLSASSYNQWAADLGLDTGAFASCLNDPTMSAEVDADFAAGQALGVSGTPSAIIIFEDDVDSATLQGAIPAAYARNIEVIQLEDKAAYRVVGALPYDAFDTILSAQLG